MLNIHILYYAWLQTTFGTNIYGNYWWQSVFLNTLSLCTPIKSYNFLRKVKFSKQYLSYKQLHAYYMGTLYAGSLQYFTADGMRKIQSG